MAVNGIELEEGQQWVTNEGDIGTLYLGRNSIYPWYLHLDDGSGSYSYTDTGKFDTGDMCEERNLKELVKECVNNVKRYSHADIIKAFSLLNLIGVNILFEKLLEIQDSEYTEYLRLKNKFQK